MTITNFNRLDANFGIISYYNSTLGLPYSEKERVGEMEKLFNGLNNKNDFEEIFYKFAVKTLDRFVLNFKMKGFHSIEKKYVEIAQNVSTIIKNRLNGKKEKINLYSLLRNLQTFNYCKDISLDMRQPTIYLKDALDSLIRLSRGRLTGYCMMEDFADSIQNIYRGSKKLELHDNWLQNGNLEHANHTWLFPNDRYRVACKLASSERLQQFEDLKFLLEREIASLTH